MASGSVIINVKVRTTAAKEAATTQLLQSSVTSSNFTRVRCRLACRLMCNRLVYLLGDIAGNACCIKLVDTNLSVYSSHRAKALMLP